MNSLHPTFRQRSPDDIVREMRQEYVERGVRLFAFRDDYVFGLSERKNVQRYQRLADLLKDDGMTNIALVITCRAHHITPELFRVIKSIGLIWVDVRVGPTSDEAALSSHQRRSSHDDARDDARALLVLEDLGICHSTQAPISDPETRLDGTAFEIRHAAARRSLGTPRRRAARSEARGLCTETELPRTPMKLAAAL